MTGVTPVWMLMPPPKHCGKQCITKWNGGDPVFLCIKCKKIVGPVFDPRPLTKVPAKDTPPS